MFVITPLSRQPFHATIAARRRLYVAHHVMPDTATNDDDAMTNRLR